MVFIHKQVYVDLENIFIGLMQWNKAVLSFEFANNYIDELLEQCYKVEKLSFHFSARYSSHKKFGSKVHRYRRNSHTIWYIIYNMDNEQNIFINKIISNHASH